MDDPRSSSAGSSEAAEPAAEPRVFSENFATGWIRRFADQWAAKRREAQNAQDLSGDSARK